jgi:arylsulfatase A-like enzyme
MRTRALRLALAILALASCEGYPMLAPEDPVPPAVLAPAPGPARAAALVLVSIDGLRPDAIDAAGATNLKKLIAAGTWCPAAETIRPSITLPSHASMVTGLDFKRHGVVWNNYRPGHIPHPTIFSVASQSGKASAMIFSKDKFHYLANPKSVSWIYGPPAPNKVPEREDYSDPDQLARFLKREAEYEKQPVPKKPAPFKPGELMSTADLVARAFKECWTTTKTPLLFVHFREPDSAGHRYGWMGPEYLDSVRQADAALGEILALLDLSKHAIIVTADHGGSSRGHYRVSDPEKAENVRIPWICAGPRVPAGKVIARTIRTMDTAPTALGFLGLGAPEGIDGRAVAEVLPQTP